MDWSSWPARLRPPLGAPHDGVCRAGPEPVHPEAETLRDCCNMGYAAGRCPRFRGGEGEAVRFSVARPNGATCVRWLLEAEGLPLLAGSVTAEALESGDPLPHAPCRVGVQLRAYWAAYRAAPQP